MIYKTKRLDEVRNNLVELIIFVLVLVWLAYILITTTKLKILILTLFVFYLIHTVYWIILRIEPTIYEIDENVIRWKNRFTSGSTGWNRVYVKFKGNKAEVHVRLAFLVVKKIILPKEEILEVRKDLGLGRT